MAYFSYTFREPLTGHRLTVDSGKTTPAEAIKDINRFLRRRYRDSLYRGRRRGLKATVFNLTAEAPVPAESEAA